MTPRYSMGKMKVLMFGWEFPPDISGGLGTACHGITKGLAEDGEVDITFTIPKKGKFGDDSHVRIVPLGEHEIDRLEFQLLSLDLIGKFHKIWRCSSQFHRYHGIMDIGSELKKVLKLNHCATRNSSNGEIPDAADAFPKPYGNNLLEEVIKYACRARRFLSSEVDFDIIHAHDWLTAIAAIEAKRILKKPFVLHVHSTEFDRAGIKADPAILAIERYAMDAADAIISVSDYTKKIVVEKFHQPASKVTTVYNAVVPKSALNPKFSKPERYCVTFLGRITYQKGPAYFLEAAKAALKEMPGLQFVMAGDGDMLTEMKLLAATLGILDHVDFPGFLDQDEVLHLLRRSAVYVMPSVSEPFGISALEAIDAGVPAIVSRSSGVAELLENVIKVDIRNTRSIADSIVRFARDPSLAEDFRLGAKEEVQKIKWGNCAKEIMLLYRAVLEDAFISPVSSQLLPVLSSSEKFPVFI